MSLNLIVALSTRPENSRITLLLLLLPLTLNLHALQLENCYASFLLRFKTGSQQINVCIPSVSVSALGILVLMHISQLPAMRILRS